MTSCCYRGGVGMLKSDLEWPGEGGGQVKNDLDDRGGPILLQPRKPLHRINKIRYPIWINSRLLFYLIYTHTLYPWCTTAYFYHEVN